MALVNSLQCGVCYERFDEGTHAPLNLPCGHCFCRSCMLLLPVNECPFDRTTFVCVDLLTRNFAVEDILAELAGTRTEGCGAAAGLSTAELAAYLEERLALDAAAKGLEQKRQTSPCLRST